VEKPQRTAPSKWRGFAHFNGDLNHSEWIEWAHKWIEGAHKSQLLPAALLAALLWELSVPIYPVLPYLRDFTFVREDNQPSNATK
jgi:hypothetical protein